jgi:hypothetical protein
MLVAVAAVGVPGLELLEPEQVRLLEVTVEPVLKTT